MNAVYLKLIKQNWLSRQKSDYIKYLRLKIILSRRLIKGNHVVKKLSKYVAALAYIDKVLIVLGATSGGASIVSFTSVVGVPVRIVRASFTLIFSLTIGIIKKLLSTTRNENKKHDKILMLPKSKLNGIETLISQALIDMEISHEEFVAIFKEKDKYEKMKESVRNVSEKLEEKTENIGLNSVNSRT